MTTVVLKNGDAALTELGNGVSRKVLAHLPEIMVVEVHFEKGGVGAVHTHPHVQSTYVKSGRYVFTIDGAEHEVAEGDTIAFPSNVPHGTLCLETGTLVDVFTPLREDFL